ncbi:S49 family peptidase [bacterium]|nr:S49 family peptidase [bacterium]
MHVPPYAKEALWREGIRAMFLLVSVVLAFVTILFSFEWWYADAQRELAGLAPLPAHCNVSVIAVTGPIGMSTNDQSIYTDVDTTLSQLRSAEQDPTIQAVLVRVDSPGGAPVASDILSAALKKSTLPVAAVIRDIGTSGAYLVATGARYIAAYPSSEVGSIGVTASYLDESGKNTEEGYRFISLTSAPYKDMLNPSRPLSEKERLLIQRDLESVHTDFVRAVARNRSLPSEDIEKLADGSSMTGSLALQRKLIDSTGGEYAALSWIAEKTGIAVPDVVLCE